MARLIQNDIVYFGVPITKVEKSPDGTSLYVYGKATDDTLDLDDQIVDRDFARKALGEWFEEFYNIRQMHSGSLPPAGIGIGLDEQKDGYWLKSEIYEPGAMLQVNKKGFKAYSVGIAQPRIIRDAKARNGRIVGGKVVEVSLVDYPANPNCKFAITEKAVGGDMQILMKMVKDPDSIQCDACKGSKMVGGEKCNKCHGTGKIMKSAEYEGYARPKEVKKAIKAWDPNAPDSLPEQAHIKSEARRLGRQDLIPDDWKEVSISLQKKADIEYAMQRLHDLTCQAYSPDTVKSAYPSVEKDGLAHAIGPSAKLALWQLIQNETVEDAGSGKSAFYLASLGDAYQALSAYLANEGGDDAMFAAQADIHKLFEKANKDILAGGGNPVPTPLAPNAGFGSADGTIGGQPDRLAGSGIGSGILTATPGMPNAENAGQISPASFRRGYISAGHMRQTGDGQSASATQPANVGSGGAPKSHPSVDGAHARQSPGDTKRAAVDLVDQLHNSLMVAFPDINCCLEPLTPGAAPKGAKIKGKKVKVVKSALTKLAVPGTKDKKVKKLKKQAKKARKQAKKAKSQLKKRKQLQKRTLAVQNGSIVKDQKEPRGTDQPEHGEAAAAADTDKPIGAIPGAAGDKKKTKKKSKVAKAKQAQKKAAKKMRKLSKQIKELAASPAEGGPVRREPLRKGVDAEAQKRKAAEAREEANQQQARLEQQAYFDPDPQARDRAQQELLRQGKPTVTQ